MDVNAVTDAHLGPSAPFIAPFIAQTNGQRIGLLLVYYANHLVHCDAEDVVKNCSRTVQGTCCMYPSTIISPFHHAFTPLWAHDTHTVFSVQIVDTGLACET